MTARDLPAATRRRRSRASPKALDSLAWPAGVVAIRLARRVLDHLRVCRLARLEIGEERAQHHICQVDVERLQHAEADGARRRAPVRTEISTSNGSINGSQANRGAL